MINLAALKFNEQGLAPAIVQDAETHVVLMMGYMNADAIEKTLALNKVTFFSRSKQRLWTKGETSNNFLELVSMKLDCDNDTILIQANPTGPTCHTGADTCWNEINTASFLPTLEKIILDRKQNPSASSYTTKLLQSGINKVAQKVGEEAVELVIESKDNNRELFLNEAADLMYHYLVLLAAKDFTLADVEAILKSRHKQ